jgi:pyruvate/oxaloacetate carboxyltransferase
MIGMLDNIGFAALEVWGGATFDVMTRYLNEDPWERIRDLKKVAPKTPFMMLLRGQNLVGYRNYPDDVVKEFVKYSAKSGIDVFRVFDALNDHRNFESSFEAIQDAGKHVQGTICYSVTEKHMGGPIFTLEYFVEKAKVIEKMGADSLCIKDMAALLSPYDAYELVSALKDAVSIPIELHAHYTSGMGQMTQLKAIEAGIDIVDTDLTPLSLRTAHPPLEPLIVTLDQTERKTGFDLNTVIDASDKLENLLQEHYSDFMAPPKFSTIDTSVLTHQVPGGMTSNLLSQLAEADALDKLPAVLKELPKTRKDLGFPPLVTPSSQIIGIQAVQNVLFGRYEMVSEQIKDYVYGLYGQPPLPMNKRVVKKVLKGYERGETPTKEKPADILEPELAKAREDIKEISSDEGDVLIYALYPVTGLQFLRWKHGIDDPPKQDSYNTKKQQESSEKDTVKLPVGPGANSRSYKVYVGEKEFDIIVESSGSTSPKIRSFRDPSQGGRPVQPPPVMSSTKSGLSAPEGGYLLTAPMPGLVIRYEVKIGDQIKQGDTLVVVEAMKMQNMLPASADGIILELPRDSGDRVAKGDALVVVGPNK